MGLNLRLRMCCWVRTWALRLDDKYVVVATRRLQPCRPVGLGPFSFCDSGISGAKQNADVVNRVQVEHKKEKKTTATVLPIFSLIHVTKHSKLKRNAWCLQDHRFSDISNRSVHFVICTNEQLGLAL